MTPEVIDGGLLDPQFAAQLDRLMLLARKILSGKLGEQHVGRRTAPASLLPADYRDYSPGDDDRFIDWNVYARLRRLVVRLFAREEDAFLHLLLDASASCHFGRPDKSIYLRRAAAALAYVGLANSRHVTISVFDSRLLAASGAWRGASRSAEMIRFLRALPAAGGKSDFAAACRQFAELCRHRGLCIVLSDFLFADCGAAGLSSLAAAGNELLCIQALSPQELSPPLDDGPVELIDAEDAAAANISADAGTLGEYQRKLRAHQRGVERAVQRHGGQFIAVGTDIPMDQLVIDALRRIARAPVGV